jgi:uncharacterized membrane protein
VTAALGVLALLGSGISAGVLFCVALSIAPAFGALPPGRYVEVHRLIGRPYDKVMPWTVMGTTATDIVLAARSGPAVGLYAAAAGLLFAVSAVSHLGNVPINRRVKHLDPAAMPPDWDDPRRVWRNWNLLRTWCAIVAFALTAAAVAVWR